MAGVDTTHGLYDQLSERWQRCRDAADGEDAVKERGTAYLPLLDSHKRNAAKYDEYKKRAMYYNAVGRTIDGLSGAIFQKAPAIEVDGDLGTQLDDITLTDEPLDLFSLHVTREYLTVGRVGILVDISKDPASTVRPYWVLYQTEDIINWKFKSLGGDKELTLVVLREVEEIQDPEDEFTIDFKTQFRVLRLTDAGVYTQQVYTEVESTDKPEPSPAPGTLGLNQVEQKIEYVGGEIITPTRRGKPLDFIPFSLPWVLHTPPLLDLVNVNLSHYRASADLKHGLHFTALPTPWVSGQQGGNSTPLSIGSGTAWSLEKDGRAGMLEFTGKGLGAIRTDMQEMQKQMATLGARLLEEAPHYAETALSVSMRHSSDYATLRMIAQVVEQQISYALKIHCWWISTKPNVVDMTAKVELNKVFFDNSMTADELRALLLALQGGTISYKTFYMRLQRTGLTREGVDSEGELKDIKEDGVQFVPVTTPQQPPDPKSKAPGSVPPPKPS
jgi:Domain of unknown function (DUF4055)